MLTSDLARSEGQPPTFVITPEVTHVDLLVPASDFSGASARGRVESVEGAAIWTGPIERPTGAPNAAARARIPVASLPPGDYIFSIAAGTSGDAPAYYFRVRGRG